jgi:hypothetical protein
LPCLFLLLQLQQEYPLLTLPFSEETRLCGLARPYIPSLAES